jgi:7-cyano-7-deazaguanine synthase
VLAPYITVRDAARAIGFYVQVFEARELFRLAEPQGRIGHAELAIGGSLLMLSDEYPDFGALSPGPRRSTDDGPAGPGRHAARHNAGMTDPRRAIVLFSGGQDSTACLAWALQRHAHVETVGFDYGQRHRVELDCRQQVLQHLRAGFPQWAARLGEDHVLDLALLGRLSDTALTAERSIDLQANGLPNTFVPGRNLLFFTLAAALAYRRGASVLVGGMCETDYSGYPDCRDNTLKALQVAISLGLAEPMTIETPLMWLTKAQTWALTHALGGDALNELVVEHTHTCYLGERTQRRPWGYGCGNCPACRLRQAGHEAWQALHTAAPPAVPAA